MDHRPDSALGRRLAPRPEPVHHCERCGTAMLETHCKIVCPRCGYFRDCSDP